MKKSVLEKLYNGDIIPCEHFSQQKDLEKQKELIIDACKQFKEKLEKPVQEEFEKLMDEHVNMLPLELEQSFIDGFRLGVNLMVESMYKPQKDMV